MTMDKSVNVFGEKLEGIDADAATGFFRDNKCNTCDQDLGSHTVCIEASQEFLEFSRFKGNDLSTPRPEFGFEGVKPHDIWCLCASRWLEAYEEDRAPRVYLRKTHIKALEIVPIELLKKYALDLS
ncbi:MAG: DUF2237 domain-containing protein [Colwellia sp.]|nr:DUF2237 domain-containing protein [Colwellia sp.]